MAKKITERDRKFYDLFTPILSGRSTKKPGLRYATMASMGKSAIFLEIDPETNICTHIDTEFLEGILYRFNATMPEKWWIVPKDVPDIIKAWKWNTPPIPEPPSFLWLDDPCNLATDEGVTFRRLPWRRADPIGETPVFDEILGRIDYPETLQAFVGSLFVHESYNQQYFWLKGAGGDSKGAFLRFLERFLGSAASCWGHLGAIEDKFWAASALVGKRAVIFFDARDNKKLMQSGRFMTLTGGDPAFIEDKFKKPVRYKHNAKIIIANNELPDIPPTPANLRRSIVVTFEKFDEKKFSARYEDLLWQEGGDIVKKCIEIYHRLCPNHEPLENRSYTDTVNGSFHEHIASSYDDKYEGIFEEHFLHEENAISNAAKVRYLLRKDIGNNKAFAEFKDWMEKSKKIKCIKTREGRVYHNLRTKGCPGKYLILNMVGRSEVV